MEEKMIKEEHKIKLSTGKDKRVLEIGDSAVANGLLKKFSGPALGIFIYLLTHMESDRSIYTNPVIISSFLPDEYELKTVKEGLDELSEKGIIEIYPRREGDYTYRIQLLFDKISSYGKGEKDVPHQERRKEVLANPEPSKEEIREALLTFVPPDLNAKLALEDINKWLADFDLPMLKELIRRVDKWLEDKNHPASRAFFYLQGIIDDWYQKEIFSYDRLQHFDQLYRETRELASLYGIRGWQNVKPAHMEIFKKWLTEDYPLSLSVAKVAIKEAFKRKKDGQPSLQYIEDNFIRPLKKAKVKNEVEAHRVLRNKKGNTTNRRKQKSDKKPARKKFTWDNLPWDFEEEGVNL